MATDIERLVLQLSADIRSMEKEFRRASGLADRSARNIESRFRTMGRRLDGIGKWAVRGLTGPLADISAALVVREVAQYSDAWKRAGNSLKVAGISGDELKSALDRIFEISQDTATNVNATADLFGKISLSAKELGATQEELFQVTEAVGNALRIEGVSAAQASGTLRQLAQALGSSRVQAEEFNSIIDGAKPLLQAVANNIDAAGGSVSKLKQLVNEGKLSNQQLFEAILKGGKELKEQASQAAITFEQAFGKISNAMKRYVGETDESLSASQRLIQALEWLAENFEQVADTTLKVAGIIASALLGRALGGMIATIPIAIKGMTAFVGALRTAQFASVAFTAALGPIGLALGAASAAIAIFASSSDTAADSFDTSRKALDKLNQSVDKAISRGISEVKIKRDEIKARLENARAILAEAKAKAAAGDNEGLPKLPIRVGGLRLDGYVEQQEQEHFERQHKRRIDQAQTAVNKLEGNLARLDEHIKNYENGFPSSGTRPNNGRRGDSGDRLNAYEKEVERIRELTKARRQDIELMGLSNAERIKQEEIIRLTNAAEAAGLPITAQKRAEIEQLATNYANLTIELQNAEKAAEGLRQANSFLAEGLSNTFTNILKGTESASEAFANLAQSIADAAFQAAFLGQGPLASVFGAGGGFGNGIASLLTSLIGLKDGGPVTAYASGGYVSGPGGPRSDSVPAMLSNGEYVVNAKATKEFLPVLEAINQGKSRALAAGGLIQRAASSSRAATNMGRPAPTVNTEITVNVQGGASGDKQQDQELAKNIGRAVEQAVDSRIIKHTRPGGLLNPTR